GLKFLRFTWRPAGAFCVMNDEIRSGVGAPPRGLTTWLGSAACRLLALSVLAGSLCPLSRAKRTWRGLISMSANDPKRTFTGRCLKSKRAVLLDRPHFD